MLLYPLGNFGQVLVLLADVVLFAEVDEEDDWLGGEEEEWVDDLDLGVFRSVKYRAEFAGQCIDDRVASKSDRTFYHDTSCVIW